MNAATARILIAALAMALLTASAGAQGVGGTGGMDGGLGGRHQRQAKTKGAETPKPKVDEKAYNAALKQLPDKHYDAWHGVR
jgi:hypothetical protein